MSLSACGCRRSLRCIFVPVLASLLLALGAGCQSVRRPLQMDADQQALFGAARMRIHPIFTQVRSFTGGAKPDGIQAELEFQDQFGDPTKASGTVRFELFPYVRGEPDPRGDRISMWEGSLQSVEEQYFRWNKTSRTYSFQLAYSGISIYGSFVLTATFQNTDGRRFFSRVILEGQQAPTKGRSTLIPGSPGGSSRPPTSLPIFPPASAPSTLPILK